MCRPCIWIVPAGSWTATHLNQQLGVFVDHRLVDAPVIKGVIDSIIAINGQFTRAQAEEVKRRLLHGGAP
jgi:preprotein translocase subunit SecD